MTGLPLNIDWQQIVLHLFNFVILSGGLYILLYKPVKDFMKKRDDYYRHMDEAADEAGKKALEAKKEYEAKLLKAEDEIAEMKKEATRAAKEAADITLANARTQAEGIIAEAKSLAESERERILSNARDEVVFLAGEATAKIMDSQKDVYENFARSVRN